MSTTVTAASAPSRRLDPCRVAVRGRRERLQQVALEARHERLRLRVAEARVELEHARPVGGEHQTGEEAADERRAATGELVEHRLVDLPDERVPRRASSHGTGE